LSQPRLCNERQLRPGDQPRSHRRFEGFQSLLEEVICASKAPTTPVEDCKCCKECMERKVAAAKP